MRSQVPLHTLQLWGNYKGTFAKISDMNQLQMGNNKKITKSQCRDVSSTIAIIAAIKFNKTS